MNGAIGDTNDNLYESEFDKGMSHRTLLLDQQQPQNNRYALDPTEV